MARTTVLGVEPLAPSGAAAELALPPRRSRLAPLLKNKLVVGGGLTVLVFIVLALLAGVISPYDPLKVNVLKGLQPPSTEYWFGTDRFGRDVFSRSIYGSRISLRVGFLSIGISLAIGSFFGLIAGYAGTTWDNLISRVMDVFFAFPPLLLAIGIAAMLGPGVNNAIIAIAVVYSPLFSRVMRAPVLAERGKEYVQAARSMGASAPRIITRHVLPNVLSPVIVQASIGIAYAILVEASLSYLGLGTQPPDPSWGTMLNEGRTFLETAWWISVFPGLFIMLAVLAFNLMGDGLRDVIDPHLRQR